MTAMPDAGCQACAAVLRKADRMSFRVMQAYTFELHQTPILEKINLCRQKKTGSQKDQVREHLFLLLEPGNIREDQYIIPGTQLRLYEPSLLQAFDCSVNMG